MQAQQIAGKVNGIDAEGNTSPLAGASIYWAGTQQGVNADSNGQFVIDRIAGERLLVASFTGYVNDTAVIAGNRHQMNFILCEGMLMEDAVIEARRQGTYIARLTPVKTELITAAGLQKLACCNLAESFENSASVTVGYADAVSGARQIQMLGLSGVYTQMLNENVPTLRGLAAPFGWNYVPGPWLESIQVSKGTSSVVNGYESTAGQINMEYKKPDGAERLFVNLFGAGDGRMEANVTTAAPVIQGKLWTGVMLHGSMERMAHDANHDGFMDMPKSYQVNFYNRWLFRSANGR
jgi:hypothetical protein